MSEGSDGSKPEAVAGPRPPDPAAQPRRPIWRRRSVLIAVLVAVAAAVAAAVLAPGAPPGPYTSLPAPCALVPAATLARYVPPFVTAQPEHDVSPLVGCSWISNTAIGERQLVVLVVIYGSSSTASQLFADNARANQFPSSPGVTASVTRPSVTGLGDQAAAQVAWLRTDVPPPTPSVVLEVRSRNADLTVTYGFNAAGTDPLPTGPQMLSDAIAVARAVLAVLASHD